MAENIKIDMTWKAATQIMIAALENGTGQGKEMARAELMRMAEILDAINAERKAEQEREKLTERVYFTEEACKAAPKSPELVDDLDSFRMAVEAAGGRYRGAYNGRGFFKGISADFDSSDEAMTLSAALATRPEVARLANVRPHIDSMGLGVVIAYDKRHFTEVAWKEAQRFEEDDE